MSTVHLGVVFDNKYKEVEYKIVIIIVEQSFDIQSFEEGGGGFKQGTKFFTFFEE